MTTEIKTRITAAAAANGCSVYFGFISEIAKAMDNDIKKGVLKYPALFVVNDITIEAHKISAFCLLVASRDADGYDLYKNAVGIIDFVGGDSTATRFNIIGDASLAFTRTFKTVNLQPLTTEKLKGIEFELVFYC